MYTSAGITVRPWVICRTGAASSKTVARFSKWASVSAPPPWLSAGSLRSLHSVTLEIPGRGECEGRVRCGIAGDEGVKHVELLRADRWNRRREQLGLGLRKGRAFSPPNARRGFLTELQNLREEAEVVELSGPAINLEAKGIRIYMAREGCLHHRREEPSPLEFGSLLQIVLYPDPRLRRKNTRVTVFDERLQQLVNEMFDIMYKTDGVGLAAPQVGANVKLMLYNPEGVRGQGAEYVLVNPKIVKYSKQRDVFKEGCLSFPQLEADVERPLSVKVEAQDIKGKKFALSLKGWQARIFQHEYDHLEGVLFHDRMTPEALSTIQPGLLKLEEAYEKATGRPPPERSEQN